MLVDVYLKSKATDADVERVRRLLTEKTSHVKKVEYVSKQEAYAQERKRNPEAYSLLGSNPLPDTFRVTPDKPDNVAGAARRAGAADRRGRARRSIDPAIDSVKNRKDETTKILTATRVVKLTMGLLAILLVLASVAADLQHDPAVAVQPPPRGRGDEARRRDRLVHPLAVHARGRLPRRARRRAGDPAARRRQDRARRSAGARLRADRGAATRSTSRRWWRCCWPRASRSRPPAPACRCGASCASEPPGPGCAPPSLWR